MSSCELLVQQLHRFEPQREALLRCLPLKRLNFLQKQGQVTIQSRLGTHHSQASVPRIPPTKTCERRNGTYIIPNSTVGPQSYVSRPLVEQTRISATILKRFHRTTNQLGEGLGGLRQDVNVNLAAFPTQHLLNNRGFFSTLLKDSRRKKLSNEMRYKTAIPSLFFS